MGGAADKDGSPAAREGEGREEGLRPEPTSLQRPADPRGNVQRTLTCPVY